MSCCICNRLDEVFIRVRNERKLRFFRSELTPVIDELLNAQESNALSVIFEHKAEHALAGSTWQ